MKRIYIRHYQTVVGSEAHIVITMSDALGTASHTSYSPKGILLMLAYYLKIFL